MGEGWRLGVTLGKRRNISRHLDVVLDNGDNRGVCDGGVDLREICQLVDNLRMKRGPKTNEHCVLQNIELNLQFAVLLLQLLLLGQDAGVHAQIDHVHGVLLGVHEVRRIDQRDDLIHIGRYALGTFSTTTLRKQLHRHNVVVHDGVDDANAVAKHNPALLLDDAEEHVESVLVLIQSIQPDLESNEVGNVRIVLHQQAKDHQQIVLDLFAIVVQRVHQLLQRNRALIHAISHERLQHHFCYLHPLD